MKTHLLNLLVLCVLAEIAVAAEPITMKLWPDGPPTAMVSKSDATVKLIQSYGGAGPNRITDVSDPTITDFRPEKPNGTSVIVAPGGGFMFLSYAHEGTQVCEWLNTLGVTAVLLKYRTPTRDEKEMFELPVQDAGRALGLVRHHAAEWKLDPKRVGLLGFSARANLAGHVSWDRGSRTYPQVTVHGSVMSDGAGRLCRLASTAAMSHWKTDRFWRRQVSETVSIRSIKRLPASL